MHLLATVRLHRTEGGQEGEEQSRFFNNGYFYTLSSLTGHFTSAVAFATVEVKRLGGKCMLPIACFEA